MSSSTDQPTTRREQVTAWFNARRAAGIHWLLLLTAVAVASAMFGWWFAGLVALAWYHAVPAYNWYRGASSDTKWYRRADRANKRSRMGRFGIFIVTAGLFAWLWYDEGFDMALILLVLLGITARLILKRDWTMLGTILTGVILGSEYGNGVSIGIALFATAIVEYERRKVRIATTFVERALPQDRPVRPPFEAPGSAYDQTFFGHPDQQPYPGGRTGVLEGDLGHRPATGRVPMPPPAGEDRTVDLTGQERRPRWAGEDPTGTHTVQPGVAPETPLQDGPPVRRRIVSEGDGA